MNKPELKLIFQRHCKVLKDKGNDFDIDKKLMTDLEL